MKPAENRITMIASTARIGAATLLATVVTVAAASAASMVPHRATYVLAPASGVGQKEATVVDGLMIFELSDDCEGHTMTDRTVILLSSGDGYNVTLDSQYSAWESKDGSSFRFLNSLRLDGREIETIRGSAIIDTSDGSGVATFTSPEEKELELPTGTLFPVRASVVSLSKIERGERQLSYILFDGSSSDGAYFASDFVVDEPLPETEPPQGDLELLESPSWHVRTAVFDLKDENAPPSTELDGQTHANGVISRFTLEFEAFAAEATLTKVEALPDSGC